MKQITGVFRALSDETRLRLFYLLNRSKKEIAVCELVDAVRGSQYNISKHLHVLENAGLVKENRNGRWVLYSVTKEVPVDISGFIEGLEAKIFDEDVKRLKKRLSLRKNNQIVSCSLAKELMSKNR